MNFWKYFLATLSTVVCLLISGIPSAHADDLENLINRQMAASTDTQSSNRSDADQLISSAMGLLGVAYRYGGTSASTGFDCSGFMQHIFRRSMQINLPRTSAEQARMGVAVSRSDLQPGDMVFFSTVGGRISHVGLYIGNNRFIHAPRTGKSIEITSMSNKYWNARYVTARRVKKNDPSRFLQ
ncbi:membrane protein [Neisseria arctica]|uniref:Membrane protein n=1 Tax=Neisseria arctica TaxID=1470200 RepID=A0A0J1C6D3_9NEIS|nr:C40 family peptidase [Neisseria arctica]KLT73893.1 membrane protein [Neisseria arctica]UOO86911.1 C40 family peptidase [Neisseria arctica]